MQKSRSTAVTVAVMLLIAMIALVAGGCASMSQTTQESAVGGALVGGVAGVLLDHRNPWRGAVIGAGAGAVIGGGIAEVSRQASIEALNSQRPVAYRTTENGRQYLVRTEPLAGETTFSRETKCKRVHEKVWDGDRLVKDKVREVCEATKRDITY